MINAKDKFREGYIMVNMPFKFAEIKNPIQKMTILYAYSERPLTEKVLTMEAEKKLDLIAHAAYPYGLESSEVLRHRDYERVTNDPKSYEELYKGEVVQATLPNSKSESITVKFFPEEYNIISEAKLKLYLQEEGYHAIITSDGILKNKDFVDRKHFLQSRGLSEHTSIKLASVGYKDLVYYKPYYGLLELFCRDNEIYLPDSFYESTGEI